MPIDFSAMNRAVMATFAETAVIDGLGNVQAIFDSRFFADTLGEQGGSTLETSIAVSDDVAAAVALELTTVTVRGQRYIAAEKRPLGVGMTSLVLWKSA